MSGSTRRPPLVYRDTYSEGQHLPPIHQGLHQAHLVKSRQALPVEVKELGDVGGGGGSSKHRGGGGDVRAGRTNYSCKLRIK